MGELHRELRKLTALEAAWRKVASRSLHSTSKDVRLDAERLRDNLVPRLRSIQSRLVHGSFRFMPQTGVLKARPNKRPRPIVIAPAENRIVQRALLDVLSTRCPGVQSVLATPTSVGGIAGVDEAIAICMAAIEQGASWYIRSDIPDFFTKIPRRPVLDFIAREAGDEELTELFERALETDLANEQQLTEDLDLFPLTSTGVAQGSSLSPLVGNILLHDFDMAMNGRGVCCVRYIDDFIILGPSRRAVLPAFEEGRRLLAEHGLTAYDPEAHPKKAAIGRCDKGIDFLGCQIVPGLVQPSKEARTRILEKVRQAFADGRRDIDSAMQGKKLKGDRFAQTLARVDRIVKGWGDAYAFCNGRQSFPRLDQRIDQEIDEFRAYFHRKARNSNPSATRRGLGVSLLTDSKVRVSTRRAVAAFAPPR